MTIEEFIEARLAEDELGAERAGGLGWEVIDRGHSARLADDVFGATVAQWDQDELPNMPYLSDNPNIMHIVRYDPARALRQVAATRELFERARPERECRGHPGPWLPHGDYGPDYCRTPGEGDSLRVIAAIWKTHPDYQEEWNI